MSSIILAGTENGVANILPIQELCRWHVGGPLRSVPTNRFELGPGNGIYLGLILDSGGKFNNVFCKNKGERRPHKSLYFAQSFTILVLIDPNTVLRLTLMKPNLIKYDSW